MMRLANDAAIASTPEQRRVLSRVVLEKARPANLLAFGQADTHLHAETASDRSDAGEAARAIEISLRRQLAIEAPFARAQLKPIESAQHLYATFRYVLRQPERHGIEADPRREDSNLPDLLGLRRIGSYTRANVRRWLPRVTREELLARLGVTDLNPVDAEHSLDQLIEAALAATALPSLDSIRPEAVAARRAVVALAGDRWRAAALAPRLHVDVRTIARLRESSVDPALLDAIRRQLRLSQQLPASVAQPLLLRRAG
jgi:hypothetical protein